MAGVHRPSLSACSLPASRAARSHRRYGVCCIECAAQGSSLASFSHKPCIVQVNCSFFGYFRKEITVPAALVSVSAFITAQNWGIFDNQLSNYKLYINGA